MNRTTGEIELTLGEDGNYAVLREQHNPDYLESESGTPTFLVADSENDRIVEYAYRGGDADDATEGGSWTRTWSVGDESAFSWPRDADRLDDGNTLITDSANHRVVEVTPEGEVVWEVYMPWLVYDATRIETPESGGPTMADLGEDATGEATLTNGEPLASDDPKLADCAALQRGFDNERWTTNGGEAAGAGGSDPAAESGSTQTERETDERTAVADAPFPRDTVLVVAAVGFLALLGAAAVALGRR